MPQLKTKSQSVEVKDGASLVTAGKKLGIPFSCENGICGTCKVTVKKGAEHLSGKTDAEEAMGIDGKKTRLLCQCKLKGGDVEIDPQ